MEEKVNPDISKEPFTDLSDKIPAEDLTVGKVLEEKTRKISPYLYT